MIGSIIQAVKGHFKDTASITDKWSKEAAKDKESKDIEKSVEEAKKNLDKQFENQEQQPQEQTEEEINAPEETSQTETVETEIKDTSKEDKSAPKSTSILSDEDTKDITTDDSGEDVTGQKTESGSGTFNQVFSIVQGIKKDLQNVGKTVEGKGSGDTFGKNTFNAAYSAYKQKEKPKSAPSKSTSGSNVPSDAQLKFVDGEESPNGSVAQSRLGSPVCLKQFFYDDDNNREFFDSDILDAYKNLQTITFTYKPEATKIDPTQDTETVHVGLKAQDIEEQPELASAVKEDPESGYKMVDTREMTMQNAAAISEIAKMLEEIQKKLNSLT